MVDYIQSIHYLPFQTSTSARAIHVTPLGEAATTWPIDGLVLATPAGLDLLVTLVGGARHEKYRETSNISCTLVGNNIVDHSDVVGASPVGVAPTTSSFSN